MGGKARSYWRLRPGVKELLNWARKRGIPVVVVTNTIPGGAVRQLLRQLEVDRYVTTVVASNEYGVRKPHPRMMEAAMQIAQAHPKYTFVLSESAAKDMVPAQQLGIAHRVLLGDDPKSEVAARLAVEQGQATHVIQKPDELIDPMDRAALRATGR